MTKSVNLGILEAFQNGIVKSTTLMVGMPAFEHAVMLAKENHGLGVGVHLTLTAGYPISKDANTLTDEDGRFLKQDKFFQSLDKINLEEVQTEFIAQIEKTLAAGIQPTHLDSHHHVQASEPILKIFCDVAKKYNLPVRNIIKKGGHLIAGNYSDLGINTTDACDVSFHDDNATVGNFIECIENFRGESLEIMCHPAYLDLELKEITSYGIQRIYELHVLKSERIKQYINEKSIVLTNFAGL